MLKRIFLSLLIIFYQPFNVRFFKYVREHFREIKKWSHHGESNKVTERKKIYIFYS